MKKITNYILICTCALGFSSCVNTFLDLEPLDAKTDVIYFKLRSISVNMLTGFTGNYWDGSLPMEVYSITWMRHPIFLLVSDIRMVWGPV